MTGSENFPTRKRGTPEDITKFFESEFMAFALFCPDLGRVVRNQVKIVVATGERSADVWYARTTLEHRKMLGCKHWDFPGNHAGFELEPEEFGRMLVGVLDGMEGER